MQKNMHEVASIDLEEARNKIDEIDDKIIDLLNERAKAVLAIAGMKRVSGGHGYDTRRESEMLKRALARSEGPLDTSRMADIFIEILDKNKEFLYEHMRQEDDG